MTVPIFFSRSAIATLLLLLFGLSAARSAEPVKVVATFSILGDMVKHVGGEHVALTTLVGPGGDTHVYQPVPADARALSEADVLVVNGLEFEGWLDRLVDASDFRGIRVVATNGIEPIPFEEGHDDDHDDEHKDAHGHGHDDDHDGEHKDAHGHGHDDDHDDEHKDAHGHGAFDPHVWLSVQGALTYVNNITEALTRADPENSSAFYQNSEKYARELKTLDVEIREIVASLPDDHRTVVTSHDAFGYFGRDYGLTFVAAQGLSTEFEASAKDIANLIRRMRAEGISAIFAESNIDRRMIEQIANETGAKIGGTLYPGTLSGPEGPASTYIELMRHNAFTLAQALR